MSNLLNKKRNNENPFCYDQTLDNSINTLVISNILSPLSKKSCKFCLKDITNSVQFVCPDCNNSFFCINCLLSPIFNDNLSWHKHKYQIVDKMNFPLFMHNWSLKEEISLLSLIEKHGLDNWEDIADSLKTKTKYECEAHYYSFYYHNESNKYPLLSEIIIEKCPNTGRIYSNTNTVIQNAQKEKKKIEEVLSNQGTIPEFTNSRGTKTIRNIKKKENDIDIAITNNIQGYWPKRFEFDVEYLNEAENDIAELEFLDEDTEEDRQLKFKMLELYNQELNERNKRKQFVIERNLLDVRKQASFEKKLPREEREIYNCLKPFARYLTPSEFQDFFEGIIIEKNLRQRIEQLKAYKAQGCKTYEDVQKKEKSYTKLSHKKNSGRDPNNINCMIAETCGIGNNIKNFLIQSNTEIIENSNEKEKSFAKRIGISKEEYNNIKKQIALTVLEERNIRGNFINVTIYRN